MITPSLLQEEEVIPVLLRLADLLLDRYEGTQKSDEELLKSGNVTGRRRLAMLVRVGERRLIRRFKEAVICMLAADDEEGEPIAAHDPYTAEKSTCFVLATCVQHHQRRSMEYCPFRWRP